MRRPLFQVGRNRYNKLREVVQPIAEASEIQGQDEIDKIAALRVNPDLIEGACSI